jgi:hypothetical protein
LNHRLSAALFGYFPRFLRKIFSLWLFAVAGAAMAAAQNEPSAELRFVCLDDRTASALALESKRALSLSLF